jgi:hypothetical protein
MLHRCQICHGQCGERGCTGAGNEDCVACKHAVHDGHCVAACPLNTYLDDVNFCQQCSSECHGKQCTGPTAQECTDWACYDTICPPGQQPDPTTCTCHAIKCDEGYYLLQQDCVSQCPDGYQTTNGKCEPCLVENCARCAGGICVECSIIAGAVEDTCSDGAFASTATCSCEPCHELCASCSGPSVSQCLECAGKQQDGRCVAACSRGYYPGSTDDCMLCDEHCVSAAGCKGPGPGACYQCEDVQLDGICVETCPKDMYTDSSQRCQTCHSNCLKGCLGPATSDCCLTDLIGGKCATSCPNNYYELDGSCHNCHSGCHLGCTGPSFNDCKVPATASTSASTSTTRAVGRTSKPGSMGPSIVDDGQEAASHSRLPTSPVEIALASVGLLAILVVLVMVVRRKVRTASMECVVAAIT